MTVSKGSDQKRSSDIRRGERCAAMIDAAEALFLERGFENTPLSAIVARSGGSLATLYDEFGGKQKLLHAVAARRRDEALKDLHGLDPESVSPRELLLQFARRFHAFVMAPRTIALTRVIIAQSLGDAAFGQAFYRDMHLDLIERLAGTFRDWNEQAKAAIPDAALAAELYFASILCNAPMKAMMGLPPEETDEHVLDARLGPFLQHFQIADN